MPRKVLLTTLVCLCMSLSVNAQRRGRNFETNDNNVINPTERLQRIERQREAADRWFEAQRNYERAKAREEAADGALSRSNPDHPQSDRLARDAAQATRDRAKAELERDLWRQEAERVGAFREARQGGAVREASVRSEPREPRTRDVDNSARDRDRARDRDTDRPRGGKWDN